MAAHKSNSLAAPDALLGSLTPRRREMMRQILEHPNDYVLLSLRGVARAIESEPATLLRTVQAMGFKQYQDFQRYLHERCIAYSTSLDVMERTIGHKNGLAGLVTQSLDRDIENVKQLRYGLDADRLAEVAIALHRARRIAILAGDMARSLAFFLDYNLAILGFNSVAVVNPGDVVHRMQHFGKQDVVIAFSFGRGLRQTIEGLKRAKAKGALCVGISDSHLSPLARFADSFFVASTERISFADSYVAAMAFNNALLVACAHSHRRRTLRLLKETAKEQRTSYRWYSEAPRPD